MSEKNQAEHNEAAARAFYDRMHVRLDFKTVFFFEKHFCRWKSTSLESVEGQGRVVCGWSAKRVVNY